MARGLAAGEFTHGVASGDPTETSVILWTRFVPAASCDGEIRWQISQDENFRRIAAQGQTVASPRHDHCVKVDATGLAPDARWFYRFLSRSGPSVTGLTRTAPARGKAPLTIAGFACSMLPIGYFRAYADCAARADIDLWAHTGDYIYEYGLEPYRRRNALLPGRTWEPDREIISYADYAARYGSYRADPDLQELHRVKPSLHVWDDHEFTNDAWLNGAENHQPETEGPWPLRRATAARAWFDWLPVRAIPGEPERIHHSLRWGDLARIVLLDSRTLRDNQPPFWQELMAPLADAPQAKFEVEAKRLWRDVMGAPERSVLGRRQEAWLADQLKGSRDAGQPWQVLIQGSVFGRFNMPAHAQSWLAQDASETEWRTRAILSRVGAIGLPFDTPLWNGFPTARDRVMASIAANGRNVLTFGGETHTAWAFNLPGGADGPAAVEIARTAVTATNGFRTNPDQPQREADLIAASPELAWCDVHHWGYMAVKVDERGTQADFIGFRDVRRPDAPVVKRARLVAEATARNVRPWTPA
jgi:alkaline phosphatase D